MLCFLLLASSGLGTTNRLMCLEVSLVLLTLKLSCRTCVHVLSLCLTQQVGCGDRESYIAQLTMSSTESWTVFSLPGCAMVLSLTGLQSITVGVHISNMVLCEYITIIIMQTIQTSTVNEKVLAEKVHPKQTFSYIFP